MSNVAQTTYRLNPFSEPLVVPSALASRRNWICWRADPDYDTQGKPKPKPKKTPIIVGPGTSFSWQRSENHVSYDEAVAAVQKHKLSGVGFVLTLGCGLVGGDLDGCRDPAAGTIEPWAQAIIDLRETYFEVSPSGEGIRFWALTGDLPVTLKKGEAGVELYSTGRYLTFTGEHIAGTPWEAQRAEETIRALMKRAADFKPSTAPAAGQSTGAPSGSFEEVADQKAYRESPMGRINQAAMASFDAWVPELLPDAEKTASGGYRVKSRDLGRPLEEDLSISPDGIKDFGVHDLGDLREGKRSPIDVVMEWSDPPKGLEEAATWLGVRVGVPFDAASTGSSGGSPETPDPGPLVPHPWVAGKVLAPREWLVHSGWAPMKKVTLLQGDGGDGKTLLLHQLQASCATGLPWIGLGVEPCTSLGVYTEDDEEDVDERQAAIDLAYGVSCCASTWGLHRLPRADMDNELVVFDRARRPALTKFYGRLVEAALDLKVRLVALDVAVDLFGGNEIIRPEVRALFRPLGALARQINGAVVMSTHVSQSGIRTEGGHSGSTDWSNAARSRLYLNRPKDDTTGALVDPDARVLTRKKSNYAALGDTVNLRWERGVLVPLGSSSAAAGAFRRPCEDVFMDILDAVTAEGHTVSHKSRSGNYAPLVATRRPFADRGGYGRADFERAMHGLLKAGRVVIVAYGKPSNPLEKLAKNTVMV